MASTCAGVLCTLPDTVHLLSICSAAPARDCQYNLLGVKKNEVAACAGVRRVQQQPGSVSLDDGRPAGPPRQLQVRLTLQEAHALEDQEHALARSCLSAWSLSA